MFAVPKTLHWMLTTVVLIGKDWTDRLITWYIRGKLEQVLEEHRVESLIKLLRGKLHIPALLPGTLAMFVGVVAFRYGVIKKCHNSQKHTLIMFVGSWALRY